MSRGVHPLGETARALIGESLAKTARTAETPPAGHARGVIGGGAERAETLSCSSPSCTSPPRGEVHERRIACGNLRKLVCAALRSTTTPCPPAEGPPALRVAAA